MSGVAGLYSATEASAGDMTDLSMLNHWVLVQKGRNRKPGRVAFRLNFAILAIWQIFVIERKKLSTLTKMLWSTVLRSATYFHFMLCYTFARLHFRWRYFGTFYSTLAYLTAEEHRTLYLKKKKKGIRRWTCLTCDLLLSKISKEKFKY